MLFKKSFIFSTCIFMIAMFFIFTLNTNFISAQEPYRQDVNLSLEAEATVLLETHTGRVLFENNGTKSMHPASITKIMTLLLAGEAVEEGLIDMDDIVIISQRAWETGGSQMFLEIGQEVTVEDLIKGIAVVSANDACIAIAEHISGSVSAFVDKMNRRAGELGLKGTNFVNTHGLHDPAQVVTAIDVAHLARFFINTQPETFALQSEREFIFNEIRQYNRNPLLGRYDGADGLKTGFLNEAGWCLAATAERGDFRLISVVLNGSSNDSRNSDSQVLLNHGYSNYELLRRAGPGETITEIEVPRGVDRTVKLMAVNNIDSVIPRGQEHHLREVISTKDELEAPVKKGEPIAKLRMYYGDEQLYETEIVAAADVERLGFFANTWRSIKDFFTGIFSRGDN